MTKRRAFRVGGACLALLVCASVALEYTIRTTELPPLDAPLSSTVLDRNDEVLRVFVADDGRWRLPVSIQSVDKGYIAQLIAYEDKRFYRHPGVDPVAMLRAALQSIIAGEIRSGGSTLTMQVARLLEQGSTGRWAGKLRQMRVALALERRLSKAEILEIYLTRAPMGGNLEGVRAASFSYFDKDARRLTPAQSALLVALPQSPEARRPDRHHTAAKQARNRVLARVAERAVIGAGDFGVAMGSTIPSQRRPFPAHAPHLADRLVRDAPQAPFHHTTLNKDLQSSLEEMLATYVHRRDPRLSGAIMVMDHRTGAVLASVGGPNYLDTMRAGFVDMTQAVRSPGSTLKPIIYALAFEDGVAHPQTLIHDQETTFGDYTPQNFDKTFRGTVTVEKALQLSLNIPAVTLLDRIGPARVLARMRRIGVQARTPGNRPPGLALALGGAGVTLEELVRLYGALANRGVDAGLHYNQSVAPTVSQHLTEAVPAWYVADILSRAPTPPTVNGAAIAFKTGTSYGHRDAWAIGFDGAHVVGVWLGRADAASMPGVLGIDAAAPLLFDAFSRISPTPVALYAAPTDSLTVSNADLPQPMREIASSGNVASVQSGPTIYYPPRGARVDINIGTDALVVKLKQAKAPVTWLVDGTVVQQDPYAGALVWHPANSGYVNISVVDALGRSANTTVFVE